MSTIYLSVNANEILQSYLLSKGHKLVLVHDTGLVYPEVATHADIYMCKLGGKPESPIFSVLGNECTGLGYKYPENIKYNGVWMGQYFIHNLKYTAPELLHEAKANSLHLINVNQGYTKCNMVVLNDHAAITEDQGILNCVNSFCVANMNVHAPFPLKLLAVTPCGVGLTGFPHGFLGGASGRVGDEIIFNGNLEAHPDFEKIRGFIISENLKLRYFKEYPLTDIGSIIENGGNL